MHSILRSKDHARDNQAPSINAPCLNAPAKFTPESFTAKIWPVKPLPAIKRMNFQCILSNLIQHIGNVK